MLCGMSRLRSFVVWFAVAGLAGAASAADDWGQLKSGMTLEQVKSAVGAPLIKSQGRGIDLWIYDHGAETVASGGVLVSWTVPAQAAKSLPRMAPTAAKPPVSPALPARETRKESEAKSVKPPLRLPLG